VEFTYTTIEPENESEHNETEETASNEVDSKKKGRIRRSIIGKFLNDVQIYHIITDMPSVKNIDQAEGIHLFITLFAENISEPGEPPRFQCQACSRVFSDRGNGHRHVRRMHPGKSVHQMMAAERAAKLDDSLPPLLEPQVHWSLNLDVDVKSENPELGRLNHEQRKQAAKLISKNDENLCVSPFCCNFFLQN
jgi:hypothetical protein